MSLVDIKLEFTIIGTYRNYRRFKYAHITTFNDIHIKLRFNEYRVIHLY